jgi:hypothetical protein
MTQQQQQAGNSSLTGSNASGLSDLAQSNSLLSRITSKYSFLSWAFFSSLSFTFCVKKDMSFTKGSPTKSSKRYYKKNPFFN